MRYIFIYNGRSDKLLIRDGIRLQLEGLSIDKMEYVTIGPGDATRFVNIYCDLNPKEEVCFVACGGSGLLNEVGHGVVNRPGKYLACLSYGGTSDLLKCFPDRNFQSVEDLLNGAVHQMDAIKANDNYAFNMINIGMDAIIANYANILSREGKSDAYRRSILKGVLTARYNHIRITADSERLNRRMLLLCTLANGKVCGGDIHCAPRAEVDDGLMDLCLVKTVSLAQLGVIMPRYIGGRHLDDPFCRRHMVYRRVKHVEIESKDLIYLCLDGELVAASHFDVDILEKSVNFILPKLK